MGGSCLLLYNRAWWVWKFPELAAGSCRQNLVPWGLWQGKKGRRQNQAAWKRVSSGSPGARFPDATLPSSLFSLLASFPPSNSATYKILSHWTSSSCRLRRVGTFPHSIVHIFLIPAYFRPKACILPGNTVTKASICCWLSVCGQLIICRTTIRTLIGDHEGMC